MFIKRIKVSNFKIFDDNEFVFGNVNTIFGDNAMGKSSIAEAITFGLYGVTSCGSSRCDNLIKKDAARAVVEVVAELPGGKRRTIKRCKTRQKNEVYLDGEKVTQDAANKVLAGDPAGIDAQTFLAMFNPLYLLGLAESEQKKAREFITGLCVPTHRDEVLKRMEPDDAALLRKSDWPDIAELRKKNSELKDKNTSLAGQAEFLRKREPVEIVPEEKIHKLRSELQSLQEQKRKIENRIQEPRPIKPSIIDERTLEIQISQLRDAYKSLQGQLLQPPPRPEPGQRCPTCGQKMPQHMHRDALENWKREVERSNGFNNELKARLQQLCASGKELAAKLELAREENKKALAKYEKDLATWEKDTASARGEIANLNGNIDTLRNELNEAKLINERAAGYRESGKILAGIEIKMAQNESDIAYNEALITALNKFQVARTEIMAEDVSSNLSRVSLKLFEITKTTAEVKPVFKLLYDEKPTPFLSLSERIKAGIELSGMVRKLRGVNVPLFVDNRESITKCNLDNVSFQIFHAAVSVGDKLEVCYE